LECKAGAVTFAAGDNVSVIPSNDLDLVDNFLTRIGFDRDLVFNVQEQISGNEISCSLGKNKCTLEIALSYFYDIASPPSSTLLQFFSLNTSNAEDQATLTSYASNYLSFRNLGYTPLDVLELFPSIELCKNDTKKDEETLSILLGLLGPIRSRYYSIASSPSVTPHMIRIVYKVVSYVTKSGQEKQGVCSNYLQSKTKGQNVAITISKTKFKLPAQNEKPIVMVGAGSGISPYFSFLEQRTYNAQQDGKQGKAVFIHGCRSETDFPLKKKVDDALAARVITDLWPAYSQKEGVKHEHVQDVITREAAVLWNMLQNEEATVYICGYIRVVFVVRGALIDVAKSIGKLNTLQAHAWLKKLELSGRLLHDQWGVSENSGEKEIRDARLRLWRRSIVAAMAFTLTKKRSKKLESIVE